MAESVRGGPLLPGRSDATQPEIQQRRQYVTWSLQVSLGGQAEWGGLQALLERAVMQFASHKAYFSDPRYVGLWIKLAQNSSAPEDMFRYMETQEVGQSHAAVYVAWAQHLQARGDLQQAERVLRQGLSCDAQPPGSLEQALRCVVQSARASGAGVAADVSSPPRNNQVDLRPRGRKRPAESAGCPVVPPPGGAPRGLSFPLMGPSRATALEGPHTARSQAGDPRRDPAAQLPASCEGAVSPFEDGGVSNCEDGGVSTCEDGGMAGGSDGAGESSRAERSMYCKEELRAGLEEFCFEELRAQRYARRQRQHVAEKLKQELEEKERLLVLRRSQPVALDPTILLSNQTILLSNQTISIATRPSSLATRPPPCVLGRAGRPSPNPLHNEVFLCPGEKGLSLKIKFPAPGLVKCE
ncbi:hypothetical protein CRUP_033144 [Coryphaenoides rupestris]|nr:hypothetical protein CRUP_033144 [Coryphaenoides rupestris]